MNRGTSRERSVVLLGQSVVYEGGPDGDEIAHRLHALLEGVWSAGPEASPILNTLLIRIVESGVVNQRIHPRHLLVGPPAGPAEEIGCFGELGVIEAPVFRHCQ